MVNHKQRQIHNVKPIRDTVVMEEVQQALKTQTEDGMRNYTIFQTGKATLLRVSDVLALKKSDVYEEDGEIKRNAYIFDQKTGKPNTLFLLPITKDLTEYYRYLKQYQKDHPKVKVFSSPWLFPSFRHPQKHIDGKRYWHIMDDVGKLLGINYLGTHTMRKTGAYRVYQQSNHDIGLVMKLLNHSSESMTLRYIGVDRETIESKLSKIDFG